MGREAKCSATYGSQSGEGKALLETTEIIFRGAFRLVIPLKQISSLEIRGAALDVSFGGETASLALGEAEAAKWIKAIREPKSVLEKLGIKEGHRVAIIGLDDPAFRDQLTARKAVLLEEPLEAVDHLLFAVASVDELPRMKKLKGALVQTGALWMLRPKGRKDLTEAQTMAAGKAAGLVDVKVVGFSELLSAEKYVIPVKARR
jgi:hypothetical protein